MLKILAALALTIGGILALIAVCYLLTCIPFVKWAFDIDETDSITIRILYGFASIIMFIIVPLYGLVLLAALFFAIYGIL